MKVVRPRASLARLICFAAMAWAVTTIAMASPPANEATQLVIVNNNRRPAGALEGNILTLTLRAGRGVWHPEGPSGPGLTIEALGETASPLSVPAPMIRVKEGTRIVASVRNDLDAALVVRGLCARDRAPCSPLAVPAGETRVVEFPAGHAWHLSLLGDSDRGAGTVSRNGRRVHCGPAGGRRRRSSARHHRVDQPLAGAARRNHARRRRRAKSSSRCSRESRS